MVKTPFVVGISKARLLTRAKVSLLIEPTTGNVRKKLTSGQLSFDGPCLEKEITTAAFATYSSSKTEFQESITGPLSL